MSRKRIINKDDYPMVTPEGWEIYENTNTKLPCICDICRKIFPKSISKIDQHKSCCCKECSHKKIGEKNKRIINKDDYPMVIPEGWEIYENTRTKLPCICQGCGCIVPKTIKDLDQQKSCYCYPCGMKIKFPQTSLKNYGYENPSQSPIVREKVILTNIKLFGVAHPKQTDSNKKKLKDGSIEWNKKRLETQHKNKTLNSSKWENKCYLLLCDLYGELNIKRNYNKDLRYPFACDFYIISEDLFIECNFYWSHGHESYDPENEKHKEIIDKWKNKNTKFYNESIKTWTISDPLKFKTAKDNNLNYLTFYTLKEFENYFEIDKIKK